MGNPAIGKHIRRAGAAGRALVGRELRCCRVELRTMGADIARPVSPAVAAGWSVAAVAWGNAVVLAGRRHGHDQLITLIGVPLFGVASAWWLCHRRGLCLSALGARVPRADRAGAFTALLLVPAAFVAVCSVLALATFGEEMRGVRAIRTLIGTAFGEELIHRGVLLALWAGTGESARRVVLANVVTFGAWHLAGATCDGSDPGQVFWPLVGTLPFLWLRLRFRSLFAAVTGHAATNIGGVFTPLQRPCPYPWG